MYKTQIKTSSTKLYLTKHKKWPGDSDGQIFESLLSEAYVTEVISENCPLLKSDVHEKIKRPGQCTRI